MKKVLYVTTVSRTINAFLIPHIEMLLDEGYEVDIATCIDRPMDKKLRERNVKIFNIPFARNPLYFGNIRAFQDLVKIQKQHCYDIIHVHTPVASLFGRLLKLFFPNVKTIYTAHGYHFLHGGPKIGWILYYPIERIMAKLTDTTITINQEDYDITIKKIKPKRTYLMNGVGLDLSQYKILSEDTNIKNRKLLGLSKDDFIIIMIAELNENKNQIQLIKAMELIKDQYPTIKVLFVGEGDQLKNLQIEATNRGLTNQIHFLGFRSNINELINISNIGVLLSHREGLPRNLMELMACGRKIIGTEIRGCKEVIENENIGKLVAVGDVLATVEAIKYYFHTRDKPIICESVNKYDVQNVCLKLKEIYQEI